MIVFVAGMQRSGSTFVFNVAREVLSRSGRVYAEPSFSVPEVLIRSSGADHIILKSHIADDLLLSLTRHGAVKTFCTYRCVEDWMSSVIASPTRLHAFAPGSGCIAISARSH